MAVNLNQNDSLGNFMNRLGQIGQSGAYTPQMKLPKPKPQATLRAFEGLGSAPSVNQGVTAGTTAIPGDLGRLMRAIRGQESGGNYRATNPSGASGAYQILQSNFVGPGGWDKEALGYDISYSQFMNNPQLQDAIAKYKLGQYLKSRGMAGAAATWYGGDWGYKNMYSRRPQNGYPSMYDYVMSVINRAR